MRRTKNAFKPKTGRWVVRTLPFWTTIAILCSARIFIFFFFFHTVVCVFFGGTQKFSIFGWANLHMTARMFSVRCVCAGILANSLLGCPASLSRLVGSESERIRAGGPKG